MIGGCMDTLVTELQVTPRFFHNWSPEQSAEVTTATTRTIHVLDYKVVI
jgi:hypothetical protein